MNEAMANQLINELKIQNTLSELELDITANIEKDKQIEQLEELISVNENKLYKMEFDAEGEYKKQYDYVDNLKQQVVDLRMSDIPTMQSALINYSKYKNQIRKHRH